VGAVRLELRLSSQSEWIKIFDPRDWTVFVPGDDPVELGGSLRIDMDVGGWLVTLRGTVVGHRETPAGMMIALGGLAASIGRFRSRAPARSQLSKEDRDRAGELLLEELIRLEQAFKHGEIGRKTHETAKRQLLEAYARLGAGISPASA